MPSRLLFILRYLCLSWLKDAHTFLETLPDRSIDLLLTDLPFYGIVKEAWDRQWQTPDEFVEWLAGILQAARPKSLKDTGTMIFFGGIGRHSQHPLLQLMTRLEGTYRYRNWITWGKRRAYGKKNDYPSAGKKSSGSPVPISSLLMSPTLMRNGATPATTRSIQRRVNLSG